MSEIVRAKKKIETGEEVSAEVSYNFGTNLEQATNLFGEEQVFAAAKANLVSQVQGVIRRGLSAGKTQDEITAIVSNWKPGDSLRVQKDPMAAFRAVLASMPREAAAQLLADMKAGLKTE